jgi:hypothetical protein
MRFRRGLDGDVAVTLRMFAELFSLPGTVAHTQDVCRLIHRTVGATGAVPGPHDDLGLDPTRQIKQLCLVRDARDAPGIDDR